MKTAHRKILVILSNILISLAIIVSGLYIFHNVYFSPVVVDGTSMEPTLNDKDYGIMDTHQNRINNIKRFDIIIIHRTEDYIIKRVIGLPGETIKYDIAGNLFINDEVTVEQFLSSEQKGHTYKSGSHACGTALELDENEYFVLGDHRSASSDSRTYGPYLKEKIAGVLFAIEGICEENGSTCSKISYHFPEFY